jgi:hypothetical protein
MLAMTLYAPQKVTRPSRTLRGRVPRGRVRAQDSERFPGGWAYFNFGKGGSGARAVAMPRQACQSCHVQNAMDDNVFVQFYPTLRAVSTKFDRKRP